VRGIRGLKAANIFQGNANKDLRSEWQSHTKPPPVLHSPNSTYISGEQMARKTKHDYYDDSFKETALDKVSIGVANE